MPAALLDLGGMSSSNPAVFRFERACLLIKEERPSLAQVALACGDFDKAHMTREWIHSPTVRRLRGLPASCHFYKTTN